MNFVTPVWSRICTDVMACAFGGGLFFAVSDMRSLAAAGFAVGLCAIGFAHWMRARIAATSSDSALSSDADDNRNAAARTRLQSLREGELSVGAHLRRGKVVDRAPGQLPSSSQGHGEVRTATRARSGADMSTAPGSGAGDFTLGMVAGLDTGSFAGGLAVGGSVAGSLVGASLSSFQNGSGPGEPSSSDTSGAK